jgi:hypothetical protein
MLKSPYNVKSLLFLLFRVKKSVQCSKGRCSDIYDPYDLINKPASVAWPR